MYLKLILRLCGRELSEPCCEGSYTERIISEAKALLQHTDTGTLQILPMHLVLNIQRILTTTSSESPGRIPGHVGHRKFEILNDWFDYYYYQRQ
jgi:hypothetical protein